MASRFVYSPLYRLHTSQLTGNNTKRWLLRCRHDRKPLDRKNQCQAKIREVFGDRLRTRERDFFCMENPIEFRLYLILTDDE